MSRANFTKATPQREKRFGYLHDAPVDPDVRRADASPAAPAVAAAPEPETGLERYAHILDAADAKPPVFSVEQFQAELAEERRAEEWQRRYEKAREYLRRPITARELDATLSAIKRHPALDGDDNG